MMESVKRVGTGAVIGVWIGLVFCGHMVTQALAENSADTASSTRAISTRSDWEQRVLQQPDELGPQVSILPDYSHRGIADGGVRLVSGEIQFDDLPPDDAYETTIFGEPEVFTVGPDMGGFGDCGGCGQCGSCVGMTGCGDGGSEFSRPCSSWWARDLSIFAGVQGFKGPPDRGRVGNFGLHEGINFGAPLGGWHGLGYQFGFLAAQSNFSGDQAVQVRRSGRTQTFGTAGIFRRSLCGGWDWGIAFDLAHDNYYDKTDLKQIRTETNFSRHGNWQVGYWGAYGVDTDNIQINANAILLEPTDQFAFFYRRFFEHGGDGRIWAGLSGDGDGVLGAEAQVPLGHGWALENRINYLIPREGRGAVGMAEESWSLSVRIVWYLGQSSRCAMESPYRPMFNVADNSMFMTDID